MDLPLSIIKSACLEILEQVHHLHEERKFEIEEKVHHIFEACLALDKQDSRGLEHPFLFEVASDIDLLSTQDQNLQKAAIISRILQP